MTCCVNLTPGRWITRPGFNKGEQMFSIFKRKRKMTTAIQVETFSTEEISLEKSQAEITGNQIDIIKLLGLKGQEGLISDNGCDLLAYPGVTDEQSWIIRTLCPARERVVNYTRTLIPLRVLEIIDYCNRRSYFKEGGMHIFDKEDQRVKDPFLIGFKKSHAEPVLLARWGEELEPWHVLKEQATKILAVIKKAYIKNEFIRLNAYSKSTEHFYDAKYLFTPSVTSY